MSIETDLYATLSTDAGVIALCGTRIYPNLAPESAARPYITYQVITGGKLSTITGVDDMTRKRIQLNCNADTYAESKSLSDAVFTALEGNGYLENDFDTYDSTVQIHTVILDWSFLAP
ncbi:DUF3168 domain-containing protein [bacterium]|nr:DUF3168 domain-containing protein [bacterium]